MRVKSAYKLGLENRLKDLFGEDGFLGI